MSQSAAPAEIAFAPEFDQPVRYMLRTRSYYLGLGYDNPYVWAHYIDAPFTPLKKPLSASRLALVTTAAPYQADKGPQGAGAAYNASAKFYEPYEGSMASKPDLRIAHVGIDRKHANMSDSECWFPYEAAKAAAQSGRIASLSPRFYGLPSNRSQRHTVEVDAPAIIAMCQADGVDVVVLVPNCPICHQSQSLLARALESAGISTVVMASAKDIIEYCGVPRMLFTDFPLGNAAARPNDPESRTFNFELALRLLESAPGPRTTMQSPLIWSPNPSWKLDYSNIERLSSEEVARLKAEAEAVRETAKALRIKTVGK
jgi:hypothetical protein